MSERNLILATGTTVPWKPMLYFFPTMPIFFIFSWFFVLQSAERPSFLHHSSLVIPAPQKLRPLALVKNETGSHVGIDPSVKNRSVLSDEEEETEDPQEMSNLVAGAGCPTDNRTAILKVYMYDLPPEFHFGLLDWKAGGGDTGRKVWPDIQGKVPSYPGGLNMQHSIEYWLTLDLLYSEFASSMEGRSAVRVLNSSEADVVFVPFFSSLSYNRFSKVSSNQKKITNAVLQDKLVEFLMKSDEWKRSGGRDHIVPAHHPNSMLSARMKLWPAMFILSDFGRYPPNIANIDKDIIAPYKHVVKRFVGDESGFRSRSTLLYFQGAIHRKAVRHPSLTPKKYTPSFHLSGLLFDMQGGFIRQKLFNLLKNEKDVHFSFGSVQRDGIKRAMQGMHSSKFCLNIAGDTPSSNRLFDAIASHCVPVIISDDIELPYEDVLNYSKFCIFVRTSDALKKSILINYIRGIGEEEWTRMWGRLKEVARFYEFQYPSKEGDAVQMIWQTIAHKVPAMRRKIHKSRRFSHTRGTADSEPVQFRHESL
ncbi:hypothetical protein SAY87_030641 [Trapa incisa]|uniref:Exostosin GT47 domain-containing protein n=1 Tax=Trapa incisa TaxID=236973 RepID=A0AAN7KPU9_9MYRT|nr:hypothetical protein SAY87_030641 [Trapa incisa]